MKPGFALNLTHEGVGLLRRCPEGWEPLGEVSLEGTNLRADLAALRAKAGAGAFQCKLVIPNSQILYTEIEAPGPTAAARREAITAALEGRTPYAVHDLVFDWAGTGRVVQVAVVAGETLLEAEGFAHEHGFGAVSFVAIPDSGDFAREPFFGLTTRWADHMPPGEKLDRDQDPIRVLAAKPEVVAPEAEPLPEGVPELVTPVLRAPVAVAEQLPAEIAGVTVPAQTSAREPVGAASVSEPAKAPEPAPEPEMPFGEDGSAWETPTQDAPAPEDKPDDISDAIVGATPKDTAKGEVAAPEAALEAAAKDGDAVPEPEPAPPAKKLSKKAAAKLAKAEAAEKAAADLAVTPVTPVEPAAPSDATEAQALAALAPASANPNVAEGPLILSFSSRRIAGATPEGEPKAKPFVLDAPVGRLDLAGAIPKIGAAAPLVGPKPALSKAAPSVAPAPLTPAAAAAAPPLGPVAELSAHADPRVTPRLAAPVTPAIVAPAKAGAVADKAAAALQAIASKALKTRDKLANGAARQANSAMRSVAEALKARVTNRRPGAAQMPTTDVAEQLEPFGPPAPVALSQSAPAFTATAKPMPKPVPQPAPAKALAPPAAKTTRSPEPAPARSKAEPAKARPKPDQVERDAMTVFGARKASAVGGSSPYLGVALTAALVLAILAVALWSSILGTGKAPEVASSSAPEAIAAPSQPVAPDANDLAAAQPETAPPDLGVAPDMTGALRPVPGDGGQDVAAETAPAVESGTLAAINDAGVNAPETEPEALTPPGVATAGAGPASIWLGSPAPAALPQADATSSALPLPPDTSIAARNAVLLPGVEALSPDVQPSAPPLPPTFGALPTLGADGAIVPTPEGVITPDGFTLFAGKPRIVPAARPAAITAAAAAPAPEPVAAPVVPDPLEGKKPKVRPAGLAPEAPAAPATDPLDDAALAVPVAEPVETAALSAPLVADPALAGSKPQERPASVTALAEARASVVQATAAASALAVASSRRPSARPSNFASAVDAAVAAAVASAVPVEPEQTAAAAPVPDIDEPEPVAAAPDIPTRASVAKQATVNNAIKLSEVNLIGVYGSSSARRALVRMANGKFVKVQVGDRLDGGKVASITDTQLTYVKSGRTIVLKMPRDG